MPSKIIDIAYYLPEGIITNSDLEAIFPDSDFSKIEKKIGIRQRHIAGEGETALDMAVIAANKLFEKNDRQKVDFLIFCTQSPDYFLPTSACIIQDRLNLGSGTGAFDYNLGCSGYIYGLAMAKGFIHAGLAKNILLITAETYSKHINEKDKSNRIIFGDAAAATLIGISDSEQIGGFDLGSDGRGCDNLIVRNGGIRNKVKNDAVEHTESSGSTYTDNDLYMNGPEIFNFTIDVVPGTVSRCLEKNGFTLDDIALVIPHQANKYMLDHLRRKMGIPVEKFYVNLENTGNTVSATIPIALKNALDEGVIKTGDKVMLAGFGVGYSWGTTIITI